MHWREYSKIMVPQIEQTLATELANSSFVPQLRDAMTYAVMAGGKRLRPMLTLAVLTTYQLPTDQYLKPASALELIHTYSLIHDDLPAMDDDDLRRGKPTTHKAFGEDIAILAGDGLQPLAFEWLTADNGIMSATQKVQLVTALAKASGAAGMVAGQVLDIAGMHSESVTLSETQTIHYHKTGALIAYALQAGAIMADATEAVQKSLYDFGMAYGLAFQIKDDLDDYGAGKVEAQAYPTILGVAATKDMLQKQVNIAQESLDKFHELTQLDTQLLASFLDYFTDKTE